jgi:hypothetical protein
MFPYSVEKGGKVQVAAAPAHDFDAARRSELPDRGSDSATGNPKLPRDRLFGRERASAYPVHASQNL